ncbi:HLA class II histocompatibility antigen, DR alpha chain-like [Coturnix japonica]|uniref:HLA class II histocompatibility antigen, DR alpha chain-like n=1 Tax=Coturnix japonica TaxID=93934 RepID=UPI0013A5CBCC|nr:HLA class II histocompatibility antigen, DR alpha chain-like [Coturnix japonica]
MAALRGAAAPLIIIGVLGGVGAVLKPHILLQAEFYQRWEGPDSSSAQFGFHFDGDELFHVELDAAQTVWRLPEFGRYASFEAQGALQNMAVGKQNLDIMIHNSNRPYPVAPELFLFPMDPVDIDEPNVLICYADKFWPPVATLEWRRNGVLVRDGVYDSVYYGRPNLLYGKFYYLPFVPQRGDVYTCAVRHWAMEGPTQRLWVFLPALRTPKGGCVHVCCEALGCGGTHTEVMGAGSPVAAVGSQRHLVVRRGVGAGHCGNRRRHRAHPARRQAQYRQRPPEGAAVTAAY